MTTRPRLQRGQRRWPGVLAVVLFAGFIVAIVQPRAGDLFELTFGASQGFPEGESVIANIGYALLNVDAGAIEVEGFLVALILIAVVLDAALGGAVMLASRDRNEGGDS